MRALGVLVCLVVLAVGRPGPATAADGHTAPVDGPVLRPFAAPATAYGPGHRGVDLAAAPGQHVRASAAGTVRFAGAVAGRRWVTVDHGGGLWTSYGPLGVVAVPRGGPVARGAVLGTVAGPPHDDGPPALHWSARRHGAYLDPLGLLRPDLTASLEGPGEWWTSARPPVPSYAPWDGTHTFGLVPPSRPATGPGWATAPNPNHVVGIAGLASRTGEPPLDLTHLGYDPEDTSQFSYAGPGGYGPEATWQEVDRAALALRDELRRRWRLRPGQAVDLVGHSLGGVVALHYLLVHHDPLDPSLPPLGHVVTIASPLEGADLANALLDARRDPRGRLVTDAVSAAVPGLDAAAPVVRDLAVGSPLLVGLADRWSAAVDDPFAGPLATGTRVLTLGADADLVVPEHRSDLPGAGHAVLPGGHDGVRHSEAVRWVLRAFLSDAPIPAEPGGLGHVVSHAIGWVHRSADDVLLR